MGNGSLRPICSLSKSFLSPSLTVHSEWLDKKEPSVKVTFFAMYVLKNQTISQNTAFLLVDIKSGLFFIQQHGKKDYF